MVKRALLLSVIACISLGSYQRNKVWKQPLTLWEDNVTKAPEKARALNGLGLAYSDGGNLDKEIGRAHV